MYNNNSNGMFPSIEGDPSINLTFLNNKIDKNMGSIFLSNLANRQSVVQNLSLLSINQKISDLEVSYNQQKESQDYLINSGFLLKEKLENGISLPSYEKINFLESMNMNRFLLNHLSDEMILIFNSINFINQNIINIYYRSFINTQYQNRLLLLSCTFPNYKNDFLCIGTEENRSNLLYNLASEIYSINGMRSVFNTFNINFSALRLTNVISIFRVIESIDSSLLPESMKPLALNSTQNLVIYLDKYSSILTDLELKYQLSEAAYNSILPYLI